MNKAKWCKQCLVYLVRDYFIQPMDPTDVAGKKRRNRKQSQSAATVMDNRISVLYKTDDKVSVRKPPDSESYVKFACKDRSSAAKAFIKGIITDVKELNFVRNDVGFLMDDLFEDASYRYPVREGLHKCTIFYVWTYLPYSKSHNTEVVPPSRDIVAFDLCYVAKKLDAAKLEMIQRFLREHSIHVYARNLHDHPGMPYQVSVLAVKQFRRAEDGESSSTRGTAKGQDDPVKSINAQPQKPPPQMPQQRGILKSLWFT